MKVCENCGCDIDGNKDGDNECQYCDGAAEVRRALVRKARRARYQALRDCGLVKVRGNLGGIYWE